MKIQFLGTDGVHGIPVWNCRCRVCTSKDPRDKRLRPAVLVSAGNKKILVDFGPDLRQQLMKFGVKKIDYALLTHAHGDHMHGSAELACQKKVVVESPADVLEEFFARMGRSRNWLKTRNPSISIREFRKKKVGAVEIDCVALEHQKDIDNKPLPCYGYIFRTRKSCFAYLSDFSRILEPEKLRGVDILVSDGSFFDKQHLGHAGIRGSIGLYRQLKPKLMILTHINHSTGTHQQMAEYARKFGNIEIAYDGMELSIK